MPFPLEAVVTSLGISTVEPICGAECQVFAMGKPGSIGVKPKTDGTTPVYHIHGERDRTLPVKLTRPDVIVRGGDHMLPFTFPKQVNEFLRERMRS